MRTQFLFTLFLVLFLLPATPVFSAVSDPTSQPDAGETPADSQEKKAVIRINTHFANIPDYTPACGEIEVPNRMPIFGMYLTREDDQLLDGKFGEYKGQALKVETKRREAKRAAEDLLLAALTYFRAMDAGYLNVQSAEFDFQYALYAWLWHLRDLESTEKELRAIAESYYGTWSMAFGQLPREHQEEVLKNFDDRAACLQKERRRSFDELREVRMRLWEQARTSGYNIMDTAALTIKLTTLEQAYARLVPEQSINKSIYATLLTTFDQSLKNRELFAELLAAYRQQPYLSDNDPVPASPANHAVRLRILKARATKALLALQMQDIKIEAAYTGQLSMTAGFRTGLANVSEAGSKAINDIWTSAELASKGKFNGLGPQIQSLALLGGAYRFLGSSFSILITTPVKDAFTEAIFKPMGNYAGLEIKNSMESALELYKQQRQALDVRIKLLQVIAEKTTKIEQGKAFISDIMQGGGLAGGASVAGKAPMTTRSLLEDPDFVDESDGGLPWIFEITCESTAERAALLLHGARYEMAGRLRSAYARIAANRGMAVDNPDRAVNQQVLQELTDPGSKPPEDFHEFMIANTDQFLYSLPIINGIKAAYELLPKFKNALQTIVGNIPDQDTYLQSLVEMQEKFDLLLAGLQTHNYSFSALQTAQWNLFLFHLHLLNNSFEYAKAYNLLRTTAWERDKLFTFVTHSSGNGRELNSDGQGLLTAVEIGQKMEFTDLSTRTSFLKLQYHALSIDYLQAAQQTRDLQIKENLRRQAFNIQGAVDLSGVAEEFEGQAVLQNLIGIYEELYYKAIEDTLTDVITANMTSYFSSSLTTKFSLLELAESADDDVGAKLWQTMNPWAGKFSVAGVFDVLEGGASDAFTNSTAQVLARQQNLFSEQEVEKATGLVFSLSKDVLKQSLPHVIKEGAIKWYVGEAEYQARAGHAEAVAAATQALYETDLILSQRLAEKVEAGDLDGAEAELKNITANKGAEQEEERARRSLSLAGLEEAGEARRQAENEIEEMVELSVAEAAKAKARSRSRDDDRLLDDAARLHADAEFKKLLKTRVPTPADLERLTSANDPLALRRQLLTEQLDIGTIRKGLTAALAHARINNDPAAAKRIKEMAKDIDRIRIDKVTSLINEFFTRERPDLAALVVSVIQVGAAEGNPEHQGIFADIDFTVFTRNGVDGDTLQEIKNELQKYFSAQGYPLASKENNGTSPLDTETFVQPWSPFDTAAAEFGDSLVNVAANKADPTRFPSYGGGIWANNNAAYSGKKLWGDGPERPDFIALKKHHANDISIDMAKFMGFIVDPHYGQAGLDTITVFEEKKKHAAKGLGKAKAALRMFDALLVSDDAGNEHYNTRTKRRDEAGDGASYEDASYHLQIYKDLKKLHDDGDMAVLSEADLSIVRDLALMKMKGDFPEIWDVLGDDINGIQRAQHIIDRIRELAPKVIALTAENQHREFERIAREGTETERKVAAVDLYRQASTLLKTANETPFGVLTSLMIPKTGFNKETGRFEVMSAEMHENAIREKLALSAAVLEETEIRSALEDAMQSRPSDDVIGAQTKERIQRIIDTIPTLGSVQLEEEEHNLNWFRDTMQKVRILRQGLPLQ
jgi:hypothetical protein